MKTVFVKSLSLFLVLSNITGMSNFSYTLNCESLMDKSDSSILKLIELLRMFIFLSLTYSALQLPSYNLRYIQLIRFWTVIVLSRVLKFQMITLINGIIKFDQKLLTLPLQITDRSLSKLFWSMISIVYLCFYGILHKYINDVLKLTKQDYGNNHLIDIIFIPPRAADFVITITTCFYLSHLGYRFSALNTIWRCLMSDPKHKLKRRTTETAMLVESLRLLHAELCDLLKIFNAGYGPIILALFVYFVFDIGFDLYYLLVFKHYSIGIAPLVNYIQTFFFVFCMLYVAWWTTDMKKKIIKNIRSSQLNNLQYKAITQIKLFMEQINVYEETELMACGILNLKMNLLLTVMVLMITIASTLIQLKTQKSFIEFLNSTFGYVPWNE